MPGGGDEVEELAERSQAGLAELLDEAAGRMAPAFRGERGFAPEIQRMLSRLMRERAGGEEADVSDVADGLAEVSTQLASLAELGLACPVVLLGDGWVPLVLRASGVEDVSVVHLYRSGSVMPLPSALAPPRRATQLMVRPLASFLALRWTFWRGGAGNVEVRSKAHNWDIVWSPPHLLVPNAFGGPSTPVTGSLPPGNYHFGIDDGSTRTWDSKIWAIPPTLGAATPHVVHVPLP